MSVQTGILHLDGREASWQEVAVLIEGLEERAPDYSDIQEMGPVGFGFRGFAIAPEDRRDQPLKNERGDLVTLDGRLDNRQDLARRLGLPATTRKSDVVLVLIGYERFGENLFQSLVGEFALALWDQERASIFLVRSLCGTRPLFYVRDKTKFTWSSELDALVIRSGIDPIVNDAYAIGFAYYQPDIDESPFENVSVVPPGSYVEITHSGATRGPVSTWHPERITTLKLPTDADYEEAWRQQVEAAIADRLRVVGPVWCELSGGLDSSTLVLMTDQILKKSKRDPATLTTTSCTYETSLDCDESFFISLVEDVRGRSGFHITEESLAPTLGLESIAFTGIANPLHRFPGRYRTVERAMKSAGARVLLSGLGGDEIFWSDYGGSPEIADLMLKGRLLSALSEAHKWSRSAAMQLVEVLLSYGIAPITGRWKWFPWRPSDGLFPPWISHKAKGWLSQPGRRFGLRVEQGINPPSCLIRVLSVRSSRALLSAAYYREYSGFHFSAPYSHQRLIEFMLSVPMHQIARPGEERSLMRRATVGLLPEKIRTRQSKGTADAPFLRALARQYETVGDVAALEVCRRGYAEPKALSMVLEDASLGRSQYSGALGRLFSLERWLRSLHLTGACCSGKPLVRTATSFPQTLHSALGMRDNEQLDQGGERRYRT